ncbi:MBL fold metallo-hydrolase [Streptomyces luteocolor]|uniref:MBL fold metallo-hydrolase n=1 Tax=Streptomyces luteocolor TaxID=285500 RepID=UPI000852C663|nr:MBL fold metallo-hydrolase [Streptomyces luteocolor]
MDVIEVLPELHMLRFPVGQAYLWRDGDELTLIDAGAAGAGAEIVRAVAGLGLRPRDVRRIVLTHFHEDHAGGAGEFAELSGAPVFAHALDAPFARAEAVGPEPVYEDWEVPIHAAAKALLPPVPAEPVLPAEIREVADGDVLDFGGGARVVAAPGHTDGSIAVHLPARGVLFTGDAVAASPVDGQVVLGVFNLDRARAIDSLRRLAALEHEVACFGHGEPVTERASEVLRAAADGYASSPSPGAPASR